MIIFCNLCHVYNRSNVQRQFFPDILYDLFLVDFLLYLNVLEPDMVLYVRFNVGA